MEFYWSLGGSRGGADPRPLAAKDAGAYSYAASFNYAQPPLTPVPLSVVPVSPAQLQAVANSPPNPNDPT